MEKHTIPAEPDFAQRRGAAAFIIAFGIIAMLFPMIVLFSEPFNLPYFLISCALTVLTLWFGIHTYLKNQGTWKNILRGFAKGMLPVLMFGILICILLYTENRENTLIAMFILTAVAGLCFLVIYKVPNPLKSIPTPVPDEPDSTAAQSKSEPLPENPPSAPPAADPIPAPSEQAAPVAHDDPASHTPEMVWTFVDTLNGSFPFLAPDGSVSVFTQPEQPHQPSPRAGAVQFPMNTLKARVQKWQELGVSVVKIYEADGSFISYSCCALLGMKEQEFIGANLAVALRLLQQTIGNPPTAEYPLALLRVAKELKETPLLAAMIYDSDGNEPISDASIHFTDASSQLMWHTVSEKKRNNYLGTEAFFQGNVGIMQQGNRVVFYGEASRVDAAVQANDMSLLNTPHTGVMHFMKTSNTKLKISSLALFTNLKHLRALFPNQRVVAVTFEEMGRFAGECDGIVIDPSASGLSFIIGNQTINQLLSLIAPQKPLSDPNDPSHNWKLSLESVGENIISVISLIRKMTNISLADAKAMISSAPVCILAHLTEPDAKAWEAKFKDAGAKVIAEQMTEPAKKEVPKDGTSYILEMQHHTFDGWQQYDFVLTGPYGWEYMLDSAQYLGESEFGEIKALTVALHPGAPEKDILDAAKSHEGPLKTCPALQSEHASLSVAGISKSLHCPVKVVFFNQTNRLRIFTLDKPNEPLLKSFTGHLLLRDLPTDLT